MTINRLVSLTLLGVTFWLLVFFQATTGELPSKKQTLQDMLLDRPAAVEVLEVVTWDTETLFATVENLIV